MIISKTHQEFANCLQRIYNIPEQQVLNQPENYLGSNWEAVINFWIYLDTLTQEQLKVVQKRYYALSLEERDKAWDKSYKAAKETTKYAGDAGNAAYYNVFYAGWAVAYATCELIGLEKLLNQGHQLVLFPLFLFYKN